MLERLKAFWAKLSNPVKIGLALLLSAAVIAKFRDLAMSFIKWTADRLVKKTLDKDQELAQKQDAANNEANKLIEDAAKLGENKPPVNADWYKK